MTAAALLCVFAFLLCDCAAFAYPSAQSEEIGSFAAETALNLDCKAAIVMELSTGAVIYEKLPDERMPEASITKIMTLLLVFEALESGKISLDDVATCSAHAASMGGSQIWLEEGEQMTVHELIKATMVGSANDAAVVLAELVAGTHESFVALMNQRAIELGMDNTAYKNCTGLDAEGHLSSARDIAIVAKALLEYEQVYEYSKIWMDSLRNGTNELVNTNKLIRTYSGATGLKTGTTSQAGCCVCATAERDGMTLIAVVMGAPNSKTRFSCASTLLDFGFANYELLDLSEVRLDIAQIPVIKGLEKSVCASVELNGTLLVPKGRAADVVAKIDVASDLEAPVEFGQHVGTVTLMLDDMPLSICEVVSEDFVDRLSVKNCFEVLWTALMRNEL